MVSKKFITDTTLSFSKICGRVRGAGTGRDGGNGNNNAPHSQSSHQQELPGAHLRILMDNILLTLG